MRRYLLIAILGIMLAIATGGSSKTANAASEHDDLVNKITTKTLINYVDNYYNKTCGSQTEDYAKRWLHQFKRQKANDRNYHITTHPIVGLAFGRSDCLF